MSTRGERMKGGRVQRVPRGKWKSCLFCDNGDGTATVLIGQQMKTHKGWQYVGRTYTVRIERVIEDKEK